MENYAFILKTINDKIADCERMIEYYREEISKKDDTIRELKEKVALLEEANRGFAEATSTLEEKIENLTI